MSAALIASNPKPIPIAFAIIPPKPTYPPPSPPLSPSLPTSTPTPTPTPAYTQDKVEVTTTTLMPSPSRQPLSPCGAMVRYTPRRRNALVPLPLLPPVPPHVVVKRIAGVVKILAASTGPVPEVKDTEMSPLSVPVPNKVEFPVEFPVEDPAPVSAPAPSPPLRPRVRKDSLTITPRFSVPILSATPSSTPTPAERAIPRPSFPVRPLSFNNLPENRRLIHPPIVFAPIQWSRPRVPSPLNPSNSHTSSAVGPHNTDGLLSTPSSLPTRTLLHPGYFIRPRPRTTTSILTPPRAWTLKHTLARGGRNDELRRCALMSSESGQKLAWMGGDVRGAVDVWEAERALEGMEDQEMDFDEDQEMDEITQAYSHQGHERDDEEVVCTGQRTAEQVLKTATACCPFEIEEPTTCIELDIEMEMECDAEMQTEMDEVTYQDSQTLKHTTTSWSDVFEVEDDLDEDY